MAEDKKERILEPEGLEKDFIERKRYDESKKWVEDNNQPICQRLLNHRSLWQKVVDWGYQRPIAYAGLVASASLLISGGLLLSIFLGGMPLLILIGLSLIIPLVLPAIDIIQHKTSDKPIHDFCSALQCQYAHTYKTAKKEEPLTNALNQMGQSMRTEAEAIVIEEKNQFANKKYDVPLGIQAKEKMRKITQGIPSEFPLSKDFTNSNVARCNVAGKEKDILRFKDSYSSTFSFGYEQASENKVKFFIQFVQEVFGINTTCNKGEGTNFSRSISHNISGSYYCELAQKDLTKILEADISKAQTKAKQFYEQWEASNRAKSSIISTLDEWAKDNQKYQEVVERIKVNLKFTLPIEGVLEGTCPINFGCVNSTPLKEISARYSALQNYLNSTFGANICQLTDNSHEKITQRENNRCTTVDIHLSIKLPITITKSSEDKPDLTSSASSASLKT